MTEPLSLLDRGYTLVVPTATLARRLRYYHDQHCIKKKLSSWESPEILDWTSWLGRFAIEVMEADRLPPVRLLSAFESSLLWNQSADHEEVDLFCPAGGCQEFMAAWELTHQWGLQDYLDAMADDEPFSVAIRHYKERCKEEKAIDLGQITSQIANLEELSELVSARKISFYGFDDFTLLQRKLIKNLVRSRAEIAVLKSPKAHSDYQCFHAPCTDTRAEIKAAALWARARLEKDSTQSIGIIVDSLESHRTLIESVFREVLEPESTHQFSHRHAPLFGFVMGKPLSEYPLVLTSQLIFHLDAEEILINDLICLLRSPYIAGAKSEWQERCHFEHTLKKSGIEKVSWEELKGRSEKSNIPPDFLRLLDNWQEHKTKKHTEKKRPSVHASYLAALLDTLGWPGEKPLDSAEQQTKGAFLEVLESFAATDTLLGSIDEKASQIILEQLLGKKGFQPESAEAPVQILQRPAAAAMGYDAIWLVGANSDAWPAPPRPNRLIPIEYQKVKGIPDASSELKLAEAKKHLLLLRATTPHLVLSYAKTKREEVLWPSALLAEVPPSPSSESGHGEELTEALSDQSTYKHLILDSALLEEVEDVMPAPLLTAGKSIKLKRAVNVLRDQLHCPFRAFARHRLALEALPQEVFGLSPSIRGGLLHRSLERLWHHLLQEGIALDDENRMPRIINTAVCDAVADFIKKAPLLKEQALRDLEIVRLSSLLAEWVAEEQKRPAFEVVYLEKQLTYQLGNLSMEIRIDRIDRVAIEGYLIIDYKTGTPLRLSDLEPETLRDVQLPLYALALRDTPDFPAGIAVAIIRTGECKWRGITDGKAVASGIAIRENWQELLKAWHIRLEQIAVDFINGVASVSPIDQGVCRNCDLQSLCRIHEEQEKYMAVSR